MIRFVTYLLLMIIVYTQANQLVKDIIQQSCGDNWFNLTEHGHNYCESITKENAARIIGILCLQK